ncbi:MAG: hypothetical protein ACRDOL_13230 [Streptosporangiaceae bacterium]
MDIEDLDDRRSYVGTTLVYSDRWGPREFWRAGQQVGCVCDPAAGIKCKYHAEADRQRAERGQER